MKPINVVGIKYENRHDTLKGIINLFRETRTLKSWLEHSEKDILDDFIEPFEFEGQRLLNAIDLVKEPDNEYDPNAIKVMMFDAYGERHHIGYVPKKETKYIHDYFKLIKQVDVEITGGTQKIIETDDNGKDYIDKYEIPYGSNSTLK